MAVKRKREEEVQAVQQQEVQQREPEQNPEAEENLGLINLAEETQEGKTGVMVDNVPGESDFPGRVGKIGKEEVQKAAGILQDYKNGKANLERRIVDNERWYKLRHWELLRNENRNPNDPEPASAWLFNSIANKHADAMDNFPEASALPREEGDKEGAKQLSSILPTVLENNEYEQTYSDVWWYKLKHGTGVQGAFWNPKKLNGLGDIEIKHVDLLNLFWQPGITDIQKSRNFFHVDLVDNEILEEAYPFLQGKLGQTNIDVTKYVYDENIDTSEKSAVVDWYYKRYNGTKEVLHYCKFCNGEVLYASENVAEMSEAGFYDHGSYPFVFDVLFVEPGMPTGFGYIDIMKSAQFYIDKMDSSILKNTLIATRPRYFVRDSGGVNETEFANLSNDFVHVTGGLGENDLRQIVTQPFSEIYLNVLQQKIEELKETSGNRDFSQGGTSSGVTAASAIAALQEAGSKLSRDMIKAAYRGFRKLNYLVIELIRQFYDEGRTFRITGASGDEEFIQFSNQGIKPQSQGNAFGIELGERMPVFDITIKSQRANPFSVVSQNELAKEFYGMGFFNPANSDQALACIEMMTFEGKDAVVNRIRQNGTLLQMVQQLQQQMLQMATIIDAQNQTNISEQMMASFQQGGMVGPGGQAQGVDANLNSLGKEVGSHNLSTQAQERAVNTGKPK